MRDPRLIWSGILTAALALAAMLALVRLVPHEEKSSPTAATDPASPTGSSLAPGTLAGPATGAAEDGRMEPAAPTRVAEVPVTVASPDPDVTQAASAARGGLVVALDPETGELGMPSPEQLRELVGPEAADLNQSHLGLVETYGPGRTVIVDLQGRFQDYSVARVGPDGRVTYRCVHDPEDLELVLEGAPHAPAEPEEE